MIPNPREFIEIEYKKNLQQIRTMPLRPRYHPIKFKNYSTWQWGCKSLYSKCVSCVN